MLTRLFGKGVHLQVGGQRVALRSRHDVEALLRSRTGPSSRRVERLERLDKPGLSRESEQLGRLQARVEQLRRAGVNGGFLLPEELAEVPDDQDWREILAGLARLDQHAAGYRSLALQSFAEYLATGQALLRNLRGSAGDKPRGAEPTDTHAGPRQRLLFDLDALRQDDRPAEDLARLPKGETVAIPMQPHQSMIMVLARYRFVVVSGSPFLLVDDDGHDLKLAPGKLVVGRSAEADVTLDAGYRAVSRRHLMVESGADRLLRLTDISSLGTYVAKEYLGKILH